MYNKLYNKVTIQRYLLYNVTYYTKLQYKITSDFLETL